MLPILGMPESLFQIDLGSIRVRRYWFAPRHCPVARAGKLQKKLQQSVHRALANCRRALRPSALLKRVFEQDLH